jgi:hypothetical protein
MKSLSIFFLALTLVSCGGGSNDIVAPLNFSENKFNEDQVETSISEMKKVILSLDSINSKTQNCSNAFDLESLKSDWKDAALGYQRLRPTEASLLDRDPQTVLKLQERYLGGAYSVSKCRLQQNTAEQLLSESSLVFDPAINSLEFLIYADVENTNFCGGSNKASIEPWLLTENKTEDICNHINSIAQTAALQLAEINKANEILYKDGESNQIFPANNLQSVYDNISVFTDQILKDKTLGQPLGLSSKCPFEGRTCPTAIEHPFAKITFEAVSKNLEGIMAVYNQQTAMSEQPISKGLYQFLLANNKKQVADEFYANLIQAHRLSTALHGQDLEAIAAALDGLENKEKCLNANVKNTEVPACALFKSIKSLSDKIKLDLRLALAVSTTKQIEGDSD